ncbi:MAG: DUF3185 domain-containing protein [Gemmatimonadetes bacterium]|nr:DUF3185 domain-containing protein [Gemmatimonadota bacterium]
MKPLVLVGIVLIVLGAAGLLYGGITYTKDSESVDLGVAEINIEDKERLSIHPALGAVVLVGGVVVAGAGMKRA